MRGCKNENGGTKLPVVCCRKTLKWKIPLAAVLTILFLFLFVALVVKRAISATRSKNSFVTMEQNPTKETTQ